MNLKIFNKLINSVQKKLIMALGITVFIPLLLMSFLYYYDTANLLRNSSSQNLKNAAALTAKDLDSFITGTTNEIWSQAQLADIIQYLSASPRERPYLEAKVSNTFKSLRRLSSSFVQSVFIIDKRGKEIFNNSSSAAITDRSGKDYFEESMALGHPGAFLEFNPAKRPYIYFVAPVRNTEGSIIGITGVKYDLEIVQNIIVRYNDLAGSNSFAIALDKNDRCIASGMMPRLITQHISPLSPKMEKSFVHSYRLGNELHSAAQIHLASLPGKIIFIQPDYVFMQPIKKNVVLIIIMSLIIFGVALFVSYGVGTLLSRPIKHLTKTSQEIISGNLNARAKIFSNDETGILASAFNQMTEKLQNEIKEVSESEIKFRTLVDNIQGVIYRGKNEPRRTFFYYSDYIQTLSGYPASDFGKMGIRNYADIIYPQDLPAINNTIQSALKGHHSFTVEYRIINKDGNIRWVSETGRGVYNQADMLEWIDGVIFDISERKQAENEIKTLNQELENRVRQRTSELEAANKELEAFSYSVSHDLRSPLRGLDGFARSILEDCGTQLDPSARHYLDRIIAAAARMSHLIDDLLKLSRITRTDIQVNSVDLTKITEEIIEKLRAANPQRNVQLLVSGPVYARGDYSLLKIALENLLANAWKFTSKQPEAIIEMGSFVREGKTNYFIRDNGIGFDMAYANKLFNPFERLHPSTEFEGTGIGLAIVKRIIKRHGGQINGEGTIGQGAVFFFTLGMK